MILLSFTARSNILPSSCPNLSLSLLPPLSVTIAVKYFYDKLTQLWPLALLLRAYQIILFCTSFVVVRWATERILYFCSFSFVLDILTIIVKENRKNKKENIFLTMKARKLKEINFCNSITHSTIIQYSVLMSTILFCKDKILLLCTLVKT